MTCPRCGRLTVQGASYCGECGCKLITGTPPVRDILKKGEREMDAAAKAAGDGLQSVIDDIVSIIKK